MKNQYYLFMNDVDRKSFVDYCVSVGLTVSDQFLRFTDVVESERDEFDPSRPSPCIHVYFSRQHGRKLTTGRIALPKSSSRDKSEEMKRVKSAYRKLMRWIIANFDDNLDVVRHDGSRLASERHWVGPDTRCAVEDGEIELYFATNGNQFILRSIDAS